eukprot:scaffold990_cov393-Prasinococcus_capsulatus_cf.AAC.27
MAGLCALPPRFSYELHTCWRVVGESALRGTEVFCDTVQGIHCVLYVFSHCGGKRECGQLCIAQAGRQTGVLRAGIWSPRLHAVS